MIDHKFLERLVQSVNATVRLPAADDDDDLRDHAIDARQEYTEWFRQLDSEGRLAPDVIEELLWHIEKDVTFELSTGARKGVPFVTAVPKFESYLSQVAYTLIGLATGGPVAGCKVIGCKKCGTFFIADTRRKGRPRQFCSVQCQDAFGQRTYRLEQLKARKHK